MEGILYTTIGEGEKVQKNLPGSEIFQPNGQGGEDDVFQLLLDLAAALRMDDPDPVEETIYRIDNALENLQNGVTKLGSMYTRLDNAELRITDQDIHKEEQLSIARDADITEWIKRYELQSLAYSSALQVGSGMLSVSLLDFIE